MGLRAIRRLIVQWGPAILMMGLIFFASSTPSRDLPSFGILDTLVKKGGHISGYFLLALAFLRGLNTPARKAAWITLGLVLLYASSDEFHQSFVPGRNASPLDVGIDLLGAGMGTWAWLASTRLRRWIRC